MKIKNIILEYYICINPNDYSDLRKEIDANEDTNDVKLLRE